MINHGGFMLGNLKIMKKSSCIFLLVSTIIIAGCATTVRVDKDRIAAEDISFFIPSANDPVGVVPVISGELRTRGYKVQIFHSYQEALNYKDKSATAFGSGFFISDDGIIISNSHLVEGAFNIFVRKVSGEKFKAKVLVEDENNDIAILKPLEPITVSKWLSLGLFQDTKLGDPIRIIGFPLSDILGTHPRVTQGIISADVGLMDDPTRFQISAPIQPGNSGGPILNEEYQVIGIATEKLSDQYAIKKTGTIPQNVNFGVKIDYARFLCGNIIKKTIESKKSNVYSLEDAIEAAVLIAKNVEDIPEGVIPHKKTQKILITWNYRYYWDVFHYTLTAFNMQWVDKNTGEVIANGNFSGDSFLSYKGIVRGVLKELFVEAGL
jgi:S1-C subfamily serine protease